MASMDYNQYNRMNVTMKQGKLKKDEHHDESKIAIKPTFFEMKHYSPKGIMEELAYMLIRPPRFIYNPEILKPSRRIGQRFTIENFLIPFELTFYKQESMRYVILYLHGNGSSRFQGTLFLPSLPNGVGLACFDFNGCGNRTGGEFITLGQNQSKDVDVAAAFLKNKGYEVIGWGRSMGAASLLMSHECNVMIADSAYSNLSALCKESSAKFLPKACCCLFHCFFPCVFACIQCKVDKLAGLEIEQMDIMKRLGELPEGKQICFIHGEEDTLIPAHHAEQLYDSFPGRKMLVLFEGSHNSTRPAEVLSKCFEFIEGGIESKERKTQSRANTQLMEMVNLQNALGQQQKLDKPDARPQMNSTMSATATHETKLSMPLALKREGSDYAPFESEHSNNPTNHINRSQLRQSSFIGPQGKIPANFCEVINSQDLQTFPNPTLQSQQQSSRRSKMAELIFSKRRA